MMAVSDAREPFAPIYAWALIAVLVSAFMALFFSLQTGVFLLLFAGIAWWAWQEPEDAFLLLLIMSPLFLMLKVTQTIGTATLLKDVLIITLFARLFAVPLLQQRLPYRRNMLFAPLILLAGWTAISLVRADSLILGVLRARDIGLYVLLYFAVLYLRHDGATQRRRAAWGTATLLIVLLLAVYQWFFAVDSAVLRFDPSRQVWIPRLSSIMAHPSIFGQYLVAAASLAGAAVLAGGGRWRLRAAGLSMLVLPFIYATYSRAVWLGLAAAGGAMGLAWLIWLARQKIPKRYLAAGAAGVALTGAVVLAGLVLFTPVGVFLRSAVDPTYASNEERIVFAARLLAPLTNAEALAGRGLGDVLVQNFRDVDLQAIDIAEGSARAVQLTKNATLVDNQWLKTFVEMGLSGLLIYGWLFWRVGKYALRLVLDDKAQSSKLKAQNFGVARGDNYLNRTVGLWGVGFLTAFVIQGFFIDIWDIYPTNALFWIVAALVSAMQAPQPADERRV